LVEALRLIEISPGTEAEEKPSTEDGDLADAGAKRELHSILKIF
jgi:hypothetical protein